MRFSVTGADKETGDDVDLVLIASSREVAEADAAKKGILVSAIKLIPDEKEVIDLVSDEEAAPGGTAAAVAAAPKAHGTITLSANSPSESGFTGEAGTRQAAAAVTGMEYHVVMNQALYLLETAVNKYLRDGWEPAGGLTVGISNNAMQYFQAIMRKRQTAEDTKHA